MVKVTSDFAAWGGWHCKTYILSDSITFNEGEINLGLSFEKDSLLGLPLSRDQSLIGSYWFSGKLKVDKYRNYYHLLPPFKQVVNTGRKRNKKFEEISEKDIIIYPTGIIEKKLHDFFASLQNDVRFKGCPLPCTIPIHQLLNNFEPELRRHYEQLISDTQIPKYRHRY